MLTKYEIHVPKRNSNNLWRNSNKKVKAIVYVYSFQLDLLKIT